MYHRKQFIDGLQEKYDNILKQNNIGSKQISVALETIFYEEGRKHFIFNQEINFICTRRRLCIVENNLSTGYKQNTRID